MREQAEPRGAAVVMHKIDLAPESATDSREYHVRNLSPSMELRSHLSVPVHDSAGLLKGAFRVYLRESRELTPDEQLMAETCARLSGIAIERNDCQFEREQKANIDALTGLPNQGRFKQAVSQLSCKQPTSWALLLLDLDNLKTTNDTFGHHAGDLLIQKVASRLSKAVEPDPAFRIGGDEFAVLLQKSPEAAYNLEHIAEHIRAAIEHPIDCDGHVMVPRATMGGASPLAADETADQVQRHADLALYHAKDIGRGGFVRYSPDIGSRIFDRLSTISMVAAALREHRIDAYYQPLVCLDTAKIVGVEALCRLKTVDGDVIPAASFDDAFTDARIASDITRRMLSIVAADVRRWIDLGIPFQHVGLNISAADLLGSALARDIESACATENLPLEYVILELRERASLGERNQILADATVKLRELGVRLALDDFGSDYASLTHLLSFPVDALKIDHPITSRVESSEACRAIVRSVVDIGRTLGMKVIAARIETLEQAASLRGLGCEIGQGHHFFGALDRSEITRQLLLRHIRRDEVEAAVVSELAQMLRNG
ncbi:MULTISPECIES: putative bifunctional diguanylate cyclase/phosphodiesterase [Sphingomonadales]|nr:MULTISPECIES: bifunctional diguanylate cyclase/phosphodiesterase [Sphingomonadaceae]EKU73427.1 diguanylate cyclase (GGDEF) domain-containing protein [Sphingobium yanoikuyae ATCC 51230]WQE08211.1 bifunctional diguanylate cyclase/phosphodiesterase [Sphingobium yanoikuyae]